MIVQTAGYSPKPTPSAWREHCIRYRNPSGRRLVPFGVVVYMGPAAVPRQIEPSSTGQILGGRAPYAAVAAASQDTL